MYYASVLPEPSDWEYKNARKIYRFRAISLTDFGCIVAESRNFAPDEIELAAWA